MIYRAAGRLQINGSFVVGNLASENELGGCSSHFLCFKLSVFNSSEKQWIISSCLKLPVLKRVVWVSVCTSGRALQGWLMKIFFSTLTFTERMILAHRNNQLCRWAWLFLTRLRATSLVSVCWIFMWNWSPRRGKVIWLLQTRWNARFQKKINLVEGGKKDKNEEPAIIAWRLNYRLSSGASQVSFTFGFHWLKMLN